MQYINELHQRITEVLMPDQPGWLTDFNYRDLAIINTNDHYATKIEKIEAKERLFEPSIAHYMYQLYLKNELDDLTRLGIQLHELTQIRRSTCEVAISNFTVQPIDLDEWIVNDEIIKIHGLSTTLIDVEQHDILYRNTIDDKAKELNRTTSTRKITFHGRNNLYKAIRDEYYYYLEDIKEYRQLYNNLKYICQNYTFHIGTLEDLFYQRRMINECQSTMEHLLRPGGWIDTFKNIDKRLDDLLENTDWGNITEISFYNSEN